MQIKLQSGQVAELGVFGAGKYLLCERGMLPGSSVGTLSPDIEIGRKYTQGGFPLPRDIRNYGNNFSLNFSDLTDGFYREYLIPMFDSMVFQGRGVFVCPNLALRNDEIDFAQLASKKYPTAAYDQVGNISKLSLNFRGYKE